MISVKLSELAQKQVKGLGKKYHSIPDDILVLIDEIEINPTNAIDLGDGFYKKRFAIGSKGKGKSGSGRAIYIFYQLNTDEEAVIVEVFDKSDKENISSARLKELKKLYKKL
ncbi:MAG: hypothetical protein EOP42_16370 [Sphingobacteriaceae bacterium]|nr:MAG: hypothetical protein EOP42_16370 [Sphingobacteriaceae bacterium]